MELRTLLPGELDGVLGLLDLWEMPGGWRGREFFGDFFAADPTFDASNVWLLIEDERPIACVQIFPRRVRICGAEVPMGGIGSVFTRPDRRGEGAAGALLERAVADMAARGMELSLLFAAPAAVPLYERHGWWSWDARRALLRPDPEAGSPAPDAMLEIDDFDAERDLAEAKELREAYARDRDGVAARDAGLWGCSLRFPGARAEEFRIARQAGKLVAYARAIPLDGYLVITEIARSEKGAGALADLVTGLLSPREPDALAAAADRRSAEFRSFAVLPDPGDRALSEGLAARRLRRTDIVDKTPMLQCLDAAALSRRLGVRLTADETPNAFLWRVLPPERFVFWLSDRF